MGRKPQCGANASKRGWKVTSRVATTCRSTSAFALSSSTVSGTQRKAVKVLSSPSSHAVCHACRNTRTCKRRE